MTVPVKKKFCDIVNQKASNKKCIVVFQFNTLE